MKMLTRITLSLMGLVLISIALLSGAFFIGSSIAAAPMEKIRVLIEVGMERRDVHALIENYDGVTEQDNTAGIIQISQVSRNITSPIVGSWFCFFKVKMKDDSVESVDAISCVD